MLGAKNQTGSQMVTETAEDRIPRPSSSSDNLTGSEPEVQPVKSMSQSMSRPSMSQSYSENIPSDVRSLWSDAEKAGSSTWNIIIAGISDEKYSNLFTKQGGYYSLTCSMKGESE